MARQHGKVQSNDGIIQSLDDHKMLAWIIKSFMLGRLDGQLSVNIYGLYWVGVNNVIED